MPYTIDNPPDKITALPKAAQEIWIAAFNAALAEYDDEGKANATAWAAVEKAGYAKDAGDKWSKRMKTITVDVDLADGWMKKIGEQLRGVFAPLMGAIDALISNGGDIATQVLPTQTCTLTVTRAADGRPRWLMIAASAVINRVGAIDSTALFDSFIRRARSSGVYPRLDFCHEGDNLSFGTADWLRRDGALYLASGTFDDTDLGRSAAAGLEADQNYWGASIAYNPTAEPLRLVAEGSIPVYTDGINNFISVVPKRIAANLFTAASATQEVKRMDTQTFDELVKLVGEAAARHFANQVDEANRTITETGMITRAEPAPITPDPPVEAVPVAEAQAGVAPGASDETTAEIPASDQERQETGELAKLVEQLAERVAKLEQRYGAEADESKRMLQGAQEASQDLEKRVAAVETHSRAWQEWLAGLPEQSSGQTGYRPREATPGFSDSGQIAAATLSQMKRDMPRKR